MLVKLQCNLTWKSLSYIYLYNVHTSQACHGLNSNGSRKPSVGLPQKKKKEEKGAKKEFILPYRFLPSYSHQSTPSEKLEYLPVGLDLPLHLKFDLRLHENELILHIVGFQVTADLNECFAGLFDLAVADELARRVWHERRQADEENDAPGNLNAQGQTPLYGTVGCVPACHAHPVAHHGAEADAAPGDSANEAAV